MKYIKRNKDWWDELVVPAREENTFDYLAAIVPKPEEHDYVLYTDGSGHQDGWGAYAAVAKHNDTDEFILRAAGNYGSTVQRNEMTAMLDGLFSIADHQIRRVMKLGLEEVNSGNPWHTLLGENRISVMWYTDRQNLAKALLFDEEGLTLNKRGNERDLWMRYSSMSRYFCITPMHTARNTIPMQKVCDSLCDVARDAMKKSLDAFREATPIQLSEKWNQTTPQNAIL